MPNDINEMKKFVNNVKKLVEKKVNNAKTDTSKKAIVQSLNEDGTANIIINGEVYNNVKIRAGLQPQINEVVLVSIPNNNTKDMFIDFAYTNYSLARKFTTIIGDGISTEIIVTHNLDTVDIITSIREVATPYSQISADIEIINANKIKLLFTDPPSQNQYKVIILG